MRNCDGFIDEARTLAESWDIPYLSPSFRNHEDLRCIGFTDIRQVWFTYTSPSYYQINWYGDKGQTVNKRAHVRIATSISRILFDCTSVSGTFLIVFRRAWRYHRSLTPSRAVEAARHHSKHTWLSESRAESPICGCLRGRGGSHAQRRRTKGIPD